MPVPVSVTAIERYCLAGRSRWRVRDHRATRWPFRSSCARPPRHRVARVDAQVQQRVVELPRIDVGRPQAARAADFQRVASPMVRRSRSSMPAIRRLTSVGLGSSVWRREKASKRCVSKAARRPAAGCPEPGVREPVGPAFNEPINPFPQRLSVHAADRCRLGQIACHPPPLPSESRRRWRFTSR